MPESKDRYEPPTPTFAKPSQIKSLQHISAAKTLEALQTDKNAVQTLLDFSEEQRQVLLPHLWHDYVQSKRAHQAAQDRTPLADRPLGFRSPYEDAVSQEFYDEYWNGPRMLNDDGESDDKTIDEAGDSDDENSENSDRSNDKDNSSDADMSSKNAASARQEEFADKWRFLAADDDHTTTTQYWYSRHNNYQRPFIKWSHEDLHTSSKTSTTIYKRLWPRIHKLRKITPQAFDPNDPIELSDLISSQMLFYRIMAVFGMPPLPKGGLSFKTCWLVELRLDERPQTQLVIHDHVGRIRVYFDGHKTDTAAAIDLLNFLVSDEVVHPFHRAPLLAGRPATDEHDDKAVKDELGE
ncbi:hypothetical protein H2200_004398 [Cladophialophora chaetospira]|uniref:Uncharacterized protein n=1 Tax=Cladophialophora chaetospira TaxID=386627 RepID=A0AA38XD89_9EURO|nr:hypothetical protein H2200_004398 [Cladophialophora chaetospira]